MLAQAHPRARKMHRWFLLSGGIGLAIAIILADLLSHDLMAHDLGSRALLKALWPAFTVSGLSGSNVAAQLLDAAIVYGGQFLLYGTGGLLVALLATSARPAPEHKSAIRNNMGPEPKP